MAPSTMLKEHFAAWGLCAAIFGAMVILSPISDNGERAIAAPAVRDGAQEARGQRWQADRRLTGEHDPWAQVSADTAHEDRMPWAGPRALKDPSLRISRQMTSTCPDAS